MRIAKYKLRALQRIRNYLSTEKAGLLATTLISMFAGKTNTKSTKTSL